MRRARRCTARITTLPFSEDQRVDQPGEPVRRDQVRERADGAQLRAPVRPAGDRPALLHRLRPVGPPRPGADALHQSDPGRRSRSTSSTTDACERDFTYVDDIVEGVVAHARACRRAGAPPAAIYNIGNNEAVQLSRVHRHAVAPPRPRGDRAHGRRCSPATCAATYASIDRLRALTGFAPRTPLAEGLVALRRVVSRVFTADRTAAAAARAAQRATRRAHGPRW